MIWDGFELFGVDCESKFFRGFFMIFASHKKFFFILFFKPEVWIFLSNMVYFDVDFEIYTFKFARGVVFSNRTCELAGKSTIYRKVFWMGKIFFSTKWINAVDFQLENGWFVRHACLYAQYSLDLQWEVVNLCAEMAIWCSFWKGQRTILYLPCFTAHFKAAPQCWKNTILFLIQCINTLY